VTKAQKLWGTFQALGNIAFAYSYSQILIEIQVYLFSLVFLNNMHMCISIWRITKY
jgi:hypothetical protein